MSRITVYQDGLLIADSGAATPPVTPPVIPPVVPPVVPPAPVDSSGISARLKALVAWDSPRYNMAQIVSIYGPLTDAERAYATASGIKDAPAPTPGGGGDPRESLRDLTGHKGNPGTFEGPAGTAAEFTVNSPIGELVQITTTTVPSAFGSVAKVTIDLLTGGTVEEYSTGNYGNTKLKFRSVGHNRLKVEMMQGGKASVQYN